MKILLANPRGFCAGVERAIKIVENAIKKHGAPIYVRHEVVHNKFVVNELKTKGAIFVEEIDEIPENEIVIFSAHGVSEKVKEDAKKIKAKIYDATCPLVTKVHKEVKKRSKNNQHVILIGHKGHPEVEGTLGQTKKDNITLIESINDIENLDFKKDEKLSYTTQTTLSIDDTKNITNKLRKKFHNIQAPKKDDICYATQNRQNAVKDIVDMADILLVLGSKNSSNSNRLKEIASNNNKPAYLIDSAKNINNNWLKNCQTVGITAGASAPEILVKEVIDYLLDYENSEVVNINTMQENVYFPIPKELEL